MKATPEQIEALNAKVKQIGSVLGFVYDAAKEDSETWNYSRELVNGEARIIISVESYDLGDVDKAVFHVSGIYPRDKKGQLHTHYQEKLPTMNSSCRKTAPQIAADIKRRFLPDYLGMVAKLRERIEKNDAYTDRQENNLNMIAQAFGVRGRKEGEKTIYLSLPSIQRCIENYSDDKVKFDVLCNPETAIEIIRILQSREPEEGRGE